MPSNSALSSDNFWDFFNDWVHYTHLISYFFPRRSWYSPHSAQLCFCKSITWAGFKKTERSFNKHLLHIACTGFWKVLLCCKITSGIFNHLTVNVSWLQLPQDILNLLGHKKITSHNPPCVPSVLAFFLNRKEFWMCSFPISLAIFGVAIVSQNPGIVVTNETLRLVQA